MIKGHCIRCGKCCQNMVLFFGFEKIRTEEDFNKLKEAFPEYGRFRIKGTHPSGVLVFSCSMLNESNFCMDYAHRPLICKKFPDPESFDYPHKLQEGCGYKIIPLRDFQEFLQDEERKS